MSTTFLRESAPSSLERVGKRWRAILAVPGEGSSGVYSEEVLREFGPSALAPGAKAFIGHDDLRSPKDMIGVYPEGAEYVDGVGLVGELEVFPHWADFVEHVGPHAGLSIYMMGEVDDDGVVTKLLPDRMNGVDLVSYPGLEGSGLVEKLYEEAKRKMLEESEDSSEEGTAAVQPQLTEKTKGNLMEKEEFEALFASLAEQVAAKVAETLAPVEPESEDVVDMAAVAEAAVKADIPEVFRKEIYEAAQGMTHEDAMALVEARKEVVEAIRKEVAPVVTETVTEGRVVESGNEFSLTEIAKVAK